MGSKEPKVAYIADSGKHHVSIDMPAHPPRLSVALFWAKAGQYGPYQTDVEQGMHRDQNPDKEVRLDDATSFEKELGRLLNHIYQRLEKGLKEAWMSRFGYDAPSGAAHFAFLDRPSALLKLYDEPEEQWARHVSEMFVYAPYAGIGQMMLGSYAHDSDVYAKWSKAHSLVVACQHLSTYAVLARGFAMGKLGAGLTAGPNPGVPVYKDGAPAAWYGTIEKAPENKVNNYKEYDVHPGDFLSGRQQKEQSGWAHIATVLRRWPLGKAETDPQNAGMGVKLQMIDTGVLAGIGDINTQDHDWLKDGAVAQSFKPARFGGVGRLPAAANLVGGVEKAKKAVPLGFARLVILEKGGRALYVSGMLPMWHGEQRFTTARYLWSLRDLPWNKHAGLVAYWALYAPTGKELFEQMVGAADGGGASCQAMVQTAEAARPSKPLGWLRLVAVVTSEPKVVRVVAKSDQKWTEAKGNKDGKAVTYDPDSPEAAKALKKPGDKAPTSTDPKRFSLPLSLDKDVKGNAAWRALQDTRGLSTEMLRKDASSGKLGPRPMSSNPVGYFNGTAAPGAAQS